MAPTTFSKIMNRFFLKFQDFVVLFDDILVVSKNHEEHEKHLEQVLNLYKENELYINPEKSSFFQNQVEYLGHIVSDNGIRVDPKRFECIVNSHTPKDIHELRSFLGFYSFFIKILLRIFAYITNPLNIILKNLNFFLWVQEQEKYFQSLNDALTHAPYAYKA